MNSMAESLALTRASQFPGGNKVFAESNWSETNNHIKDIFMENQHRQIKGYRELDQAEIALMNEIKATGEQLGQLVEKLKGFNGQLDQRWISIGATELQKGLMSLTRGVAQPTSF